MNRLLGDSLEGSTAMSAALGGTISGLSGGDFKNGAMTAAFAHLYNEWQHRGQVAGIGSNGNVRTNSQKVKIELNDARRSPLGINQFAIEYTYSTKEPGTFPIFTRVGGAGYGMSSSWGHSFIEPVDLNWNITILPQTKSCANCSEPAVDVYEWID